MIVYAVKKRYAGRRGKGVNGVNNGYWIHLITADARDRRERGKKVTTHWT